MLLVDNACAAGILTSLCVTPCQICCKIVPVPAKLAVGGFILWDIFNASQGDSAIDRAGHLGGAAFGLGYYVYLLRRRPSAWR